MIIHQPAKKFKLGDIFEIQTSQGCFYIQYCNFHERLGYLLRKVTGKFSQAQTDVQMLANLDTAFYFHYPLHAGLRQKCVRRVGHADLRVQDQEMPIFLNPIDKMIIGLDRTPLWEVIEPNGKVYQVKKLSEAQKNLPMWVLLTHTGLEIYLNNDWSPRKANLNYELHGTTWMKPEII